LITEPLAKINVREDGKFYEWEGDIVGSGEMTVVTERPYEQIDYDLQFLKPWKSKAKVSFIFSEEGEGTRVSWTMDSSLPWFLFWMKKMTTAFISMDYDRGLTMLKEYVEEGEVHSDLLIKGIESYGGCTYVGVRTTCPMGQLGQYNKADFESLMGFFREKHPDLIADSPFTIYEKWQPVKNIVSYVAGVPVKSVPSDLPEGAIVEKIPATKVHTVKHTGPYHYIGNVWSAQLSRQRAKKFKVNKKIFPFEVYLNSPVDTPPNLLETEVRFPVVG
jgi:predicted transcriptional regulator YdeE